MAISGRIETTQDSEVSPWVGQRMALEEFLALPDDGPSLEYVDGVVTQKVSPKPVHGSIQSFLVISFDAFARPKRLGVVLPDTRFATPNWAPSPDIVFYRRERLRVRRPPDDFFEPPDLAIEIVSPGQSVTSLMRKCLRYLEVGVKVAVIVVPEDRAVLAFRPDQPLRILQGDDRIDLDDVLSGFELTVRALFEAINWDWLDEDAAGEGQAEEETPDRSGA
jgi:Uma2 family endonuclease